MIRTLGHRIGGLCAPIRGKAFSTNAAFARSLPGSAYVDPALYEVERKYLLGPRWQLVGHESQLLKDADKAPATYIAETIAGWPTIVVRSSKTGQINAYHNVCRHKAGPLQWDGTSGACDLHGLKCKYHGWTYSLEGKLVGVPGFSTDHCGHLDRSELQLWPMRVARWRGLLFLQSLPTDTGAAMSGPSADAQFLEENRAFCDRLSGGDVGGSRGVPLEDFEFHSATTHTIKCNWKVYVENYLEGYHIPTIHPGLNQQVDMKQYIVKVHKGFVEHESPTLPGSNSAYEGVWVWHAPAMAINWYGDGLSLERIVPTGPATTEIRYQYLFRKRQPGESAETQEQRRQHAIDTSAEVTGEDVGICEAVQRSLQGGAYLSPGFLSPRHEQGVAYFQSLVREAHAQAEM
ncbi:ring hydroxylating alpha subunit-domain-containing protein [Ochromonadaceae sp. CCMP2298]|nr:ring hydroxylating alpha subunit-domain-containing protein [Ochromonadaceae sp. CCMP2298]|mmetsp:Transcript_31222/g.67200  ORF Transcript_31222/g.67200 Transcript_31222/m.67200 type:complete len:404 (+) Transcript_31222:68-1279(+)